MTIRAFQMPDKDPLGMLSGFENPMEKERILRWFLERSIKAGEFVTVPSRSDYSALVKDGLLQEKVKGEYRLTSRAISLLYPFYKKEW